MIGADQSTLISRIYLDTPNELQSWGVGMDVSQDEIDAQGAYRFSDEVTASEFAEEADDGTLRMFGMFVKADHVNDIATHGRIMTIDATFSTDEFVDSTE